MPGSTPWWRARASLFLPLLLAACALADSPKRSEVLKSDIARCDSSYAHGPAVPAADEQRWRDCVHLAARQLLLPAVRLPDIYSLLLVEDRRLSLAIAAGEADRAERSRRLRGLAERIEAVEAGDPARPAAGANDRAAAPPEEIEAARRYLVERLAE